MLFWTLDDWDVELLYQETTTYHNRLNMVVVLDATINTLFTIPKSLTTLGIGIYQLPGAICTSSVLSGNDLAMLANVERISKKKESNALSLEERHRKAKELKE